jgi:hypothetical protein
MFGKNKMKVTLSLVLTICTIWLAACNINQSPASSGSESGKKENTD